MEMERYAFISDNYYEYQMRVCPSDLIIYLLRVRNRGRRTAFALKERKEIIEGG